MESIVLVACVATVGIVGMVAMGHRSADAIANDGQDGRGPGPMATAGQAGTIGTPVPVIPGGGVGSLDPRIVAIIESAASRGGSPSTDNGGDGQGNATGEAAGTGDAVGTGAAVGAGATAGNATANGIPTIGSAAGAGQATAAGATPIGSAVDLGTAIDLGTAGAGRGKGSEGSSRGGRGDGGGGGGFLSTLGNVLDTGIDAAHSAVSTTASGAKFAMSYGRRALNTARTVLGVLAESVTGHDDAPAKKKLTPAIAAMLARTLRDATATLASFPSPEEAEANTKALAERVERERLAQEAAAAQAAAEQAAAEQAAAAQAAAEQAAAEKAAREKAFYEAVAIQQAAAAAWDNKSSMEKLQSIASEVPYPMDGLNMKVEAFQGHWGAYCHPVNVGRYGCQANTLYVSPTVIARGHDFTLAILSHEMAHAATLRAYYANDPAVVAGFAAFANKYTGGNHDQAMEFIADSVCMGWGTCGAEHHYVNPSASMIQDAMTLVR